MQINTNVPTWILIAACSRKRRRLLIPGAVARMRLRMGKSLSNSLRSTSGTSSLTSGYFLECRKPSHHLAARERRFHEKEEQARCERESDQEYDDGQDG